MSLQPGIYENVPFADYLQIPAASATALKALAHPDKTPAHVWATKEETPSLALGTEVHSATLEPEAWEKTVAIYEGGDRRGKAWTAFQEANPGKTIYKPNEIEAVLAMRQNIWDHPNASKILAGSEREVTIIWIDEETGLLCKARLDILNRALGIAGDIKTCQAACERKFAYSIRDYGYHIQAPHYLAGCAAVGLDIQTFVFIAIETKAPFFIQLFQLDQEAMEYGERCRRESLARFLECQTQSHWPGYPTGVTTIQLP